MTTTDQKVAKLPAWVQQHIGNLERQVASLRAELTVITQDKMGPHTNPRFNVARTLGPIVAVDEWTCLRVVTNEPHGSETQKELGGW